MKKTKFDIAARAAGFMVNAAKSSESRWSMAEKVITEQPSGMAKVSENQVHETTAMAQATPKLPPQGTPVTALDVLVVPISSVRDNPRNARKLYDPAIVSLRAASLRQDGQMTPAPACVDWENPSEFILIGGHYRKKGLLQNGATHIQIKLLPAKSNVDLYRLSYAENDQRESGTPLDDALSWKELLDDGDVKNQDEIAAMVMKPRTTINKTLALLSLSGPVLDVLKESPEKFTLTAGYELSVMASLFTEPELVVIAQRVAGGEISTRDLAALKENRKNPKFRKQKEISRQHKIMVPGTVDGMIKEWDSGRVVLEVVIQDPFERERLVNELRKRFNVQAEPDAV